MQKRIIVFVAAAFVLPAFGSQPGQPVDCNDRVFLEPGLTGSGAFMRINVMHLSVQPVTPMEGRDVSRA